MMAADETVLSFALLAALWSWRAISAMLQPCANRCARSQSPRLVNVTVASLSVLNSSVVGPCGGGFGHCRAPLCGITGLEVLVHADGGSGECVDGVRVGRGPCCAVLCPALGFVGRVSGRYKLNAEAGRVDKCSADSGP